MECTAAAVAQVRQTRRWNHVRAYRIFKMDTCSDHVCVCVNEMGGVECVVVRVCGCVRGVEIIQASHQKKVSALSLSSIQGLTYRAHTHARTRAHAGCALRVLHKAAAFTFHKDSSQCDLSSTPLSYHISPGTAEAVSGCAGACPTKPSPNNTDARLPGPMPPSFPTNTTYPPAMSTMPVCHLLALRRLANNHTTPFFFPLLFSPLALTCC